ncbi:MAG TPA: hypothetical protein VFJ72_09795, partial [Rubrobacteraceae bacterium]|nr:hypothetical protein [Rubrobacteraceae bacterium]
MSATRMRQDNTIVFVAFEPRPYREIIGETLRTLRPMLYVSVVEPDDLVNQTARLLPALVFCSQKKHLTIPASTDWIEYYFTDEGPLTVLVNGRREETATLTIEGML